MVIDFKGLGAGRVDKLPANHHKLLLNKCLSPGPGRCKRDLVSKCETCSLQHQKNKVSLQSHSNGFPSVIASAKSKL
ncbi:hypothetical protein AV530_000780 [Patagioenas fasciata monilis]|uniref:Uncharacterized protein n=1 Tax=Patagioenas fasciata monilis TaxID=372326 RepID=A0A1V4KTT0_PATFA|nr:hypothetical protein AV530_000780 [Patagioenas fasciata monilis]